MTHNPGFKVTGYLKVEYLADGARVCNCTKHSCRSLGALPKTCKNGGRRWNILLKALAVRRFTPVMEIKPNRVSLRWNFYADIQLIRGRFWLQRWTLKKFSEPRVSLNDGSKEVENGESLIYFAALSRMRSIAWWHFQWPWRTPNPVFKVTCFLKSNISKTVHFRDKVTTDSIRKPYPIYRMVPQSMTLSDLWPRFQGHDIFDTE